MSRTTARARPSSDRASLYDDITNKILAKLEAGRVPCPWTEVGEKRHRRARPGFLAPQARRRRRWRSLSVADPTASASE
ncbi:MAG: ArdC family protein [Kaiparowitsia implicata GSE-PSE-MK54-09C]|nr:ArdC family protein [Kaiparowitsia implicata GSE-PSE-MK54-09C]